MVHRATGPWSPAVHAFLAFLDGRVPHVPRVLGADEQGREMLTYLPGRVVDVDTEELTDAQIRSVVQWTAVFHDAVEGFTHPGPWRLPTLGDGDLVGHNDIAPYNVCFDGDRLVGVFDWDLSGPTTRLMELAFVAWNCVPLWREMDPVRAAERLRVMAAAYDRLDPVEILDAVPARIAPMLVEIPRAAANGDGGMRHLMELGEPERSAASLAALVRRIPDIRRRLA